MSIERNIRQCNPNHGFVREIVASRPFLWTGLMIAIVVAVVLAIWWGSGGQNLIPPQTPPAVNSARYPEAVVKINDQELGGRQVTLQKGRQYVFSGSFRLATEKDRSRPVQVVTLAFLSHHVPSGDVSAMGNRQRRRELILSRESIESFTVHDDGVLHFKGSLEAPSPKRSGEVELRLSIRDHELAEYSPVASYVVRLVDKEQP